MPLEKTEYEYATPPAAAMMEALRGIGYNLSTAVADLVDNSISANAKNLWLEFHWDGKSSYVTILDDGIGMSEEQLAEAMRPGSANPLLERDARDLGRFGLGLKTASLSQCRRFTVASRQNAGPISVRRWDLDYVLECNEWRVLKSPATRSAARLEPLAQLRSGTLVLWEVADQLVGDSDVNDVVAHNAFLRNIDAVREHLAMVFHRFLEGKNPDLQIFINGADSEHKLVPWDPFLPQHTATISTPIDPMRLGSGLIKVQGFVLPHKDKLGEELHRAAAGPRGWNAHQGFYVYRNKRLLVPGSWLDLGWTKEEHYKLARIKLDIPNSMDLAWKIDVKKSVARPPTAIRERLRTLAEGVRKTAREVFSHRGNSSRPRNAEPLVRAWEAVQRDGRNTYRLNREHPLIAECFKVGTLESQSVHRALRVAEATVPIERIWLDVAEHPDAQAGPHQNLRDNEVLAVMQSLYVALRQTNRLSREDAVKRLLLIEPFNAFPYLVDQLTDPNS